MTFWKSMTDSTRDWILIVFCLGWAGPVLALVCWSMWTGRIELTLVVAINLIFLLLAVVGGLSLLAERLGLLSSTGHTKQ